MRRTVTSIAILSLCGSACGGDEPSTADTGSESTGGSSESTGGSPTTAPADTSGGETTAAATSGDTTGGSASSGSTGENLCGNGDLDEGEACDDANNEEGDACHADCTLAFEIAWEAIYNAEMSSNDVASDVVLDEDDNVYVLGSHRVANEASNVWLRQYMADGTEGWTFTFDGPDSLDDSGLAIARTPDGDFIITGYTESEPESTGEDILLMRVLSDGSGADWVEVIDGPGFGPNENDDVDQGHDVMVDADGNIIVTGEVRVGSLNWDAWVAQYSPDGDQVWEATFAGAAGRQDTGRDLHIDEDGTIHVLVRESLANNESQTVVLTYDSSGMADPADPTVLDMIGRDWQFRDDGSRLVSGSTADALDAALVAFDDAWTQDWMQVINDPAGGDDFGLGIAVATDGTIVQVGDSSHPPQGLNAFVAAFATDGTPIWSDRYTDDDNDFDQSFRAVAVDSAGDVIAVGYGFRMGEQANAVVRKYHPL